MNINFDFTKVYEMHAWLPEMKTKNAGVGTVIQKRNHRIRTLLHRLTSR